MENTEILVTSESSGMLWNCCAWDYTTGTTLSNIKSCKGGVSGSRTLDTISNQYLISAEPGKPIINIWSVLRKDQPQIRIVAPGKIKALAVTPDGTFCLGAVGEKVHVWQISTGELLTVIVHHYQPVTCLKTTDDGSFFISAGEDNLVFVCKLAKKLSTVITSTSRSSDDTPYYTWSHHSLPVTDICIGKGGRRAKVVTVSLDHTCRLYSLRNGQLLMSVIMEESLTSVAMDSPEFSIFAGGSNGHIFQINLLEPPQTPEINFSAGKDGKNAFCGHSKAVTCLTISLDGQVLISGSDDQSVKIWDIPSRQCLRSFLHKGSITNVLLIAIPPQQSIAAKTNTSAPCIQNFRSYLCGSDNLDGEWDHKACIAIASEWQSNFSSILKDAKQLFHEENAEVDKLKQQIEELHKRNDTLYDLAVNKIL